MHQADTPLAERRIESLTAAAEKRLLVAIARRLPRCVHSDHLTALGALGMAGAGACYALVTLSPIALLAVNLCLFVNWFGDSLDGMLARVRACERPRYGFYLDHVVDAFGVIAVLAGVAASGLLEPVLALALLVAYLLLQVHIALKAHALGVFQIAFGGIGGTELRILVGLLNLLVWWRDLPLSEGASATFEAAAGLALAGLVLVTLADVARTTGELWRRERLPAPPPDSAMDASAAWSSTREGRGGQGRAALLLRLDADDRVNPRRDRPGAATQRPGVGTSRCSSSSSMSRKSRGLSVQSRAPTVSAQAAIARSISRPRRLDTRR